MNTGIRRALSLHIVYGLCAFNASAATRICSVYVESFSEMQKQAAVGAGSFQAPMLAALPMMRTGSLPGAAQMDPSKPVALSRIMAIMLAARPGMPDFAKGIPVGEGIVFANWPFRDEWLPAMLIPASEMKAVMAGVMAGQTDARQRNAPKRPPIPENF